MSIMSKVMQGVAQVMPDRAEDPLKDRHRLLGKPVDRLDGRAKVTGTATFAAEVELPRLSYAALVHATVPHATIEFMDTSAAEQAPGVISVITQANAPRTNPPPMFNPAGGTDAGASSVNLLNTDEVLYDGQPVAVVVAETQEQAEQAATLVRVQYTMHPAKLSFESEKARAEKPGKIMGEDREVVHGKPGESLAQSPFIVDEHYDTPRYNHNAIELHGLTVEWTDGDHLVVHDASQYVRGIADTLAKIFSLKPENVRVLSPFVGGGFGGKGSMWPHVQLAVSAARVVQRPVRLVLSREGVFRTIGGRTPSTQRVQLGAQQDGRLDTLVHTGVTATSFSNDFAEQFTFPARYLYAADNFRVDQDVVRLNMTANTFMRAPGESIGTFAVESAMDELAWKLKLDPIDLRARNEPDKHPAKHTPFSSRNLSQAYAIGREKFGWDKRPNALRAQKDSEWLVGTGVATAFYPAYRFPAAARVQLNADGTVVVQSSAQEMGMGTATVQTQHVAERLGLTMDQVRFEYGDTTLPAAPVAGGSNQTVSVALAIQLACEALHTKLLKLVKGDERSPLNKAGLEDVEARSGGLFLKSKASAGETYAAILERAGKPSLDAEATSGMPLESMKYAMGSFGAQFCEVRVHEITGEIRIARWLGVFDTGRILNPKTANSQFRGGIIMGIGMALMEESYFDERSGRIMNPSLAEYHVPVHLDIPHIDVEFLDIPDPHTPLGAHGIGEIGITGTAAAIANAIFHATGKRIRRLPITLDMLM